MSEENNIMKKHKIFYKYLIAGLLSICILISGIILNYNFGFTNFLFYNKNINLNKETGSFIKYAEMYGSTLYDYVDMCDAIIMGNVISNGIGFEEDWSYDISIMEQRTTTFPLTKTQIEVDEVLYGSVNNKVINLIQMGSPNITDIEAKVKYGQTVIILLKDHGNGIDYSSVSVENGIFYIEDLKLYTLSPMEDLNKYDGCDTKILLTDMNRIIKFNNLSPENSEAKRYE
jgi:hypothetical protein